MRRLSVILTSAFLLALHAQIQPSAPQLSENGKFRLAVPQTENHYAILSRSKDLVEWRPVDIIALSQAENWIRDSVTPSDKAYFQVRVVPNSDPRDTDGDGINDFSELNTSGTGCTALNPATKFPSTSGSRFMLDRATFDALSKTSGVPGAQEIRLVKFLITDIRTNPRLHFVNSNTHPLHYDFARRALNRYTNFDYNTGRFFFDRETYIGGSGRKNIAGSLISHQNYVANDGRKGIYTVEFWPTDPLPFEFIELAYEAIARCAPFIDQLLYHAPSQTQRQLQTLNQEKFDASFVHTIDTNDLFSNTDYQPMHQQEAFGRLRVADSAGSLGARDIVIFRNLPNDLTKIAGIITEVPQTPLSHVNLKAQQNDTPNAYIANASTHPDIAPFIGKNVFYRVSQDGFEIRIATQVEVDQFLENLRPLTPSFPPRDLSKTTIQPLSSVFFSESDSFGGKAANVAELRRIMPANAPDGFAIPFYFYDEFMKHNNFYTEAQAMITAPDFQSNLTIREARLETFRSRIKKESTFPAWMETALTTLQNSFPSDISPRLRSSANAEDSITFNGAGLYDSYTHKANEGHIGKSVRQVWASLWNYRAYEEREFYRIDHLTSAMGVLVHSNQKNEQANGVTVASNIFIPTREGYYINAQIGEDLVTNPDVASSPEEILVSPLFGAETYEIQYIRFSNQLPNDKRVLTKPQILDLVAKMKLLNKHFKSLYNSSDSSFAMEIEFKITSEGKLLIKQARPWVN
jgi:hypothetical protein